MFKAIRYTLLASTFLSAAAAAPYADAAASLSVCSGSNNPTFGVLPIAGNGVGVILDPTTSQPFVPRGVGVMEGQEASLASLQASFPGINFVRYAIYDYRSPDQLAAYVNSLTSAGIVVEIEDHNNGAGNAGGSQGTIFTGQTLSTELSWYSAIAAAFKSNAWVWFGTDNEPSETDASGQQDPSALSAWQLSTYQAIRKAGNNSIVMLELNGYADPASMGQGYNAVDYRQMYNVVWDMHVYGWLTNYSTDQTTNDQFIAASVRQAETFTSSGGVKIPVLIGEYGNSTTGTNIDPNGTQVVKAVQRAALNGTVVGTSAWAWAQGNPGDGLLGGAGLSAYGQQVASYLQQPVTTAAIASTASSCSATTTLASSVTVTDGGATAPQQTNGSQPDVAEPPSVSDTITNANNQANAILQQEAAQPGSAGSDPATDAAISAGNAQLQAAQAAMAGAGQ